MKMRVLTAGLVLMFAGSATLAQETPARPDKATPSVQPDEKKEKVLTVGDKAPPLNIEKWVKGEPVTGFEKGKVYVVEFWATWCGPCIAGMPHLTQLQKDLKSKGVTIIGVTSRDSHGNTLEAVEEMVEAKGDEKMGYTVAWDKDRSTNEAYLRAANRTTIPSAFVVDQESRIAWIGNPNFPKGEIDRVLDEILAGKYDIEAAAKKYEETRAAELKAREEAAEQNRAFSEIRSALSGERFDEAIKLIDEALAAKPANAAQLTVVKFQALVAKKDFPGAFAWAQEATEKHLTEKTPMNAMAVNSMAWFILDDDSITTRDYAVALKLAEKAVALSDNKDGMILDTLALAQFENGDPVKAYETQKKAVELSKDDDRLDKESMEEMKERLAKFEKAAKEKK